MKIRLTLLSLVLLGVAAPRVGAQAGSAVVQSGRVPVQSGDAAARVEGVPAGSGVNASDELTATVAAAWSVPGDSVHVEIPTDVPERVDSLVAVEGSDERWVVTFWVHESAARRFVRAGTLRQLPAASRDLPRGHPLESDDVEVVTRPAWGSPGEPSSSPVGWVTQRRIRAGELLTPPAARPPLLVRGGDQVEAVLEGFGVVLTVRAEALSSAREGDPVSVRMPSGRRMEGRATGPGLVSLSGGSR